MPGCAPDAGPLPCGDAAVPLLASLAVVGDALWEGAFPDARLYSYAAPAGRDRKVASGTYT